MNNSHGKRHYRVDQPAKDLGVKFQAAEIYGVTVNKENSELQKAKSEVARLALSISMETNPILQGYKELFNLVGVKNVMASPEWLIRLVKDHGKLPTINTVVDAYNVRSIESLLVVSAHDLEKVQGDVRIETTVGDETFYPLGSQQPETLPSGEWVGVDDSHILCRMNCKQSDLSKVSPATKNLLIYVQGNRVTDEEYLRYGLVSVCEYIIKINGGEYQLLDQKS